jgi:mannose-6-phosphate isomerase-like protein (cupin superfamily)
MTQLAKFVTIPAQAGYPWQKWVPACTGMGGKVTEDMPSTAWDAKQIDDAAVVTAPDGSEVRILCATGRGSMIRFTLKPGAISRAVAHRTVEEIWYVTAGSGRLWRKLDDREEITDLAPGLSLTIPVGTQFQFRNDGDRSLDIIAVTMPPWPGHQEASVVTGVWDPGG